MNACAATALFLIAGAVVSPARATAPPSLEVHYIVQELRAGRPFVRSGVVIHQRLDLTMARITAPFVCRRCSFEQGLRAPHVVFSRGIDLSGSTLHGRTDFRGARFDDTALFGPDAPDDDLGVGFRSGVDFSFASFAELAVFRKVLFARAADFSSSHFRSFARFGDATFAGPVLFDEAIFARDVSFFRAAFDYAGRFAGAAFGGVADFRQAAFSRSTTFEEAIFRDRAEFSEAQLAGEANFTDSRFAGDALFRGTEFLLLAAPSLEEPLVIFDHSAIRGRLDFDGATLTGSVALSDASIQSLWLDDIEYADSADLFIAGLSTTDATLDLTDVSHIQGVTDQERKILQRAEETAKNAGDLGLANDLHYRLQEVASSDDGWPRRYLDAIFYRTIAGYFVRPFRPLFWLVVLVVLAGVIRALRPKWHPGVLQIRSFERVQRMIVTGGREFIRAVLRTLDVRGHEGFRQIELAIYAVLLACFVLALANTNPTLRNMVDAVI